MPSTVCFGARDDSYGFSKTSKAGNIIAFKLTYTWPVIHRTQAINPNGDAFGTISFPTKWPRWQLTKTVIFFTQRLISYQIIGAASFTACLGPQPNRHNCSLIISLPRWRWRRTKNSKSGTARTCSNGVMAIMGSKKRVLQCMVCMFEQSPKLQSKLKKRVPKLLFMPLLLQY